MKHWLEDPEECRQRAWRAAHATPEKDEPDDTPIVQEYTQDQLERWLRAT